MWVVAGILLGLVVLAAVVGFHSGPHTHAVAGVIGLCAAAWLILMVAEGRSAPGLWALLAADLVVSAGVGTMAWFGLSRAKDASAEHHHRPLDGAEGVAVSRLAPDGIVRVHGEQWSATSLNGTVAAGTPVQVLGSAGVHLDVWGEEVESTPENNPPSFDLPEAQPKEPNP